MHQPFAPESSLLLVKFSNPYAKLLDLILSSNEIRLVLLLRFLRLSPLLSLSRLSFPLCWVLFLVHQLSFPTTFSLVSQGLEVWKLEF